MLRFTPGRLFLPGQDGSPENVAYGFYLRRNGGLAFFFCGFFQADGKVQVFPGKHADSFLNAGFFRFHLLELQRLGNRKRNFPAVFFPTGSLGKYRRQHGFGIPEIFRQGGDDQQPDHKGADLPEIIEAFDGDTRKVFANEYWDDRAVYMAEEEDDWAAREIALACQSEREASEGTDDWDYGVACYESALRAYRSLMQDGHSGFSIQITKSILNRLIDGKCLTPIEDTEDIWNEVTGEMDVKDGRREFQCKRMSSLFKTIASDGTTTYSDVGRVCGVNANSPDVAFTNGLMTRLIDKLFPITMPYLPATKKYRVFSEDFLVDPKNGDYDTIAYLYILTPNDKRIELNRYFKEEGGKMVPIEKAEYEERKTKRVDKK